MANPLEEQARQLVAGALDPSIQAVEARRRQEQEAAARKAAQIQALTQAYAEMQRGIAPQIQGFYRQAGNDQATYGRGYSLGMQLAQQASAAEANAMLEKIGAPAGQMIQPHPGGADVLYGLGGELPASTMQREGAAFASAAAMLPATTLGRGQQILRDFEFDASQADRKLLDEIAELEAKRPGAIQEAVLELRELQMKERAQKLNEEIAVQELGLKRDQLGISAANAQTSRIRARTGQANAQTARINAQIRKLESDRNWQIRMRDLGIKEAGLSQRAAELEVKSRTSAKRGGFTAKQKRELQQIAFDTARDDYDGYDSETDTSDPARRVRPVETLRDLIASGVPFSIAIKAINRFWPHTKAWARPARRPRQGN